MKKTISALLALAMALSLAACGAGTADKTAEKSAEQSEEPAVRTYRIGIAVYDFRDVYMQLYREELESYFKTLQSDTVQYELTAVDGKSDAAEQKKQIEAFIARGMDAIILNLVQTSSAEDVIQKIADAGIPLILINREPLGENGDESYGPIIDNPKVCYIGADARQSGTFQGDIIWDLPDHGDINGDGKVSYIMLEGDVENPDARYRTEYSVKALMGHGMAVEQIDRQVGDWMFERGQEIAAVDLARYGDSIEVVFCNNDLMALGASVSIAAAGRTVGKDIYLVGVDALDICVQMVRDGTMTGTVRNDYVSQSHKAADVAAMAAAGGEMQNYYWLDYVKVTG